MLIYTGLEKQYLMKLQNSFRRTKIICTIGPASTDEDTVTQMCLAGMNVARMNFSHNTYADHKQRIDIVKKVRVKLGLPIAIMLDTKGPEYRIKTFENGKVELCEGDEFTFTVNDVQGNKSVVSVSYKNLPYELEKGDRVLLNNGLLIFEVESTTDTDINCRVLTGGELSDRKSMSFPNKVLKQKYLSEQDKADILFGIKNDIDFIACSFVSCKQDVLNVRDFLKQNGAEHIDIIAKIENRSGVDNIEEICEVSDGIMIARGDMGVEIPFEEMPAIQKMIINKCRMLGKCVVTATEMLESMIYNIRPTRAEISDVANAVYDGTSAIMLSGETAAGKHPVLAVEAMARIAQNAENTIHYSKRFLSRDFKIKNTIDAISHATCGMAIDVGARAIAVCSLSGMTARMVSRFRPYAQIIGITTDEKTQRELALAWGVIPILCKNYTSTDELFEAAAKHTKQALGLKNGEKIVITGGITNGSSGNTNLIKVETIQA